MSNYLFLFTIANVQGFISQARKTQDLFAGSSLLSQLIDHAINELKNLNGITKIDIIFPEAKTPSKPNRFIAFITTDDPNHVGEVIKDSLKKKFKGIANDTFSKFNISNINSEIQQQLDDLLQIYWIALESNGDYFDKYNELERLLGGIKNVRPFKQLLEEGRKCSLCGERNVLFYKKRDSKDSGKHIPEHVTIKQKEYSFNPGEGLCAVCTAKRFISDKNSNSFPSTARISLLHALSKLRHETEGITKLDIYKKIFTEGRFDEQLYFEENLTKHYFEKNNLVDLLDLLPGIQKKQQEIRNYASDKEVKLCKYYAVVVFDGDSMGEWLAGDNLKDKKKDLEKFHRKLSEYLGNFANFAQDFLQAPEDKYISAYKGFLGKAVYSGGDDFLGFVNLNYLFSFLNEIREKFNEMVNEPIKEEFDFTNPEKNFTFSAGVSIAHYKMPLSIALATAREMEKMAKGVKGKDAVAFALLKHSGNISQSVVNWKYSAIGINAMTFAEEISNALTDWISNKFLFTLRDEFLHLVEEKKRLFNFKGVIGSEIYRLLNRRKRKEKLIQVYATEDLQKQYIKNLAEQLSAFLFEIEKMKDVNLNAFTNFINFLEICNFISREK